MKDEKRIVRKLACITLCIVLFATMLVVPVSTNVRAEEGEEPEYSPPPGLDEPSLPAEFEYDIYLADISVSSESMYPELIFVNTLNNVDITFSNKGEKDVTDMMVEVYEVKYAYIDPPGGDMSREPFVMNENYMGSTFFGDFPPEYGQTETIPWVPIDIGEHTIKLMISYNEGSVNVAYDEEVTFCVMNPDLPVIEMFEDWIIDEDTTMTDVTIILEGDIVVNEGATLTLIDSNLRAGSLDIFGEVIFTNVNFDVGCTFRGQYYIWVHDGGIFRILGSMIFNNPPQNTYHFWVDGEIECQEWGRYTTIMHVYGEDSGGTETGGIMLRNINPGEQSTFRRTIVRECDTIGIGCYGSSPILYPYVMLQFNGDILGPSPYGYGKGLYAEGATANPWIERCWVRYNNGNFNRGYGIRLRDDASATILRNYIYRNTYAAIYCYYASPAIMIQNNWIFDNNYYGVMDYRSSPTIDSNTIIENSYGVYAYFSSPTISSNTIDSGSYGIICSRASATITDNMISEFYHGILIYWTPSPTIEGNTITSNRYLGIYVYRSSPTIQYNEISSNSYSLTTHSYGGIFGYYATPTIKFNTIISNYGWGIWMRYDAPTNAATIGTDNTYSPENTMGRVWQEWWLRVRTADADSGFVPNSYVEVYDQVSWPSSIWTGYSGSTGYTPTLTVTEYKIPNLQTSKDYYTPHTIRAEKDVTDYTYTAIKLETMDDNKVVEINFDLRRFAVLIAPANNPSEEQAFKGDISKMRDYFLDKGWRDSNIWFLTSGPEPYIDGDANRANVVTALDDFEARSSDQDIVFIQFVDHGAGYRDAYGANTNYGGRLDGSGGDPIDEDDDSYCSIGGGGDSKDPAGNDYDGALCTKSGYFYDDEFNDELNDITCRYLVFTVVACFSGEFIEDCSNDFTSTGRIINTAAPENDFAYWSPPNYTFYAYYFHQGLTWTSSLGTNNPDTSYPVSNANGRIEIEEAHAYAEQYDGPDEPKIWDWKVSTNLYLP